MTRILVIMLALAGCSAGPGARTVSEDGTVTNTGEASFSFCFGFCLHRLGPPITITPVAVAAPKR